MTILEGLLEDDSTSKESSSPAQADSAETGQRTSDATRIQVVDLLIDLCTAHEFVKAVVDNSCVLKNCFKLLQITTNHNLIARVLKLTSKVIKSGFDVS